MTTRPLIPVDISEALFLAEVLRSILNRNCGPRTYEQTKLDQMIEAYVTRIEKAR